MTSATKSYCRSWHDAAAAVAEAISVGSFCRQHPQATSQAYFMPGSELRAPTGLMEWKINAKKHPKPTVLSLFSPQGSDQAVDTKNLAHHLETWSKESLEVQQHSDLKPKLTLGHSQEDTESTFRKHYILYYKYCKATSVYYRAIMQIRIQDELDCLGEGQPQTCSLHSAGMVVGQKNPIRYLFKEQRKLAHQSTLCSTFPLWVFST